MEVDPEVEIARPAQAPVEASGLLLFSCVTAILPGVRQGSIPEDTDLIEALRLLNGGEEEVLRAISLIDSAAAANDATALERRALLEAIGLARPQDWDRSLDSLQKAAEHGSESAQHQLRILAPAEPEHGDWRGIRSAISIERLLEAPQKQVISEAPRLRAIREFASPAECLWLVKRARDRLRPATVVTHSGSQTVEMARTNRATAFQLGDMDLVMEVVRARISAATRLPLPLFETCQILHYAPGQEFRAHHDYFNPQNPGHAEQLRRGQRIATFLVYLNESYTGGETAFPRAEVSFRGNAGDALFITNVDRTGNPDPLTLHAGTPPASGEKWIFSQWIRDRRPPVPPGMPRHS
jgi:prolyl 4-hydroxylase